MSRYLTYTVSKISNLSLKSKNCQFLNTCSPGTTRVRIEYLAVKRFFRHYQKAPFFYPVFLNIVADYAESLQEVYNEGTVLSYAPNILFVSARCTKPEITIYMELHWQGLWDHCISTADVECTATRRIR